MVEYILGNYLAESGKITREQLKMVMEKQDSVRVKLGLIAVSEGMMTLEEAERVNRLQAIEDKRFGDIAIEKGYLTRLQLDKLLKKQGSAYLIFVQTLVNEGLVALDELDWLLNDFRQENGYSFSELEDIKSDEADRIVPLLLPEGGKQFTELVCTVVRVMIRLIDRHIYIGKAAMVEEFPTSDSAIQIFKWEQGLADSFSERDGALLNVCSVFGREKFERLDIDALDAAGELLNCVNGLYVSGLSREGEFLELMPPVYNECRERINKSAICRIPVFVGDKGLYFTVAELA